MTFSPFALSTVPTAGLETIPPAATSNAMAASRILRFGGRFTWRRLRL